MNLKLVWGGIIAYFFLFWLAVGNLGTALSCTLFLALIGLRITLATIKAQPSAHQSQTDQTQGAANWNQPPGQ